MVVDSNALQTFWTNNPKACRDGWIPDEFVIRRGSQPLRFVIQGSAMVLQQISPDKRGDWTWQDVPLVTEAVEGISIGG